MILPWPCRIPLAKSPLYFPSCPITSTRFIFAFNIAFRDFGFVAFSLAFYISNSVPMDIADISWDISFELSCGSLPIASDGCSDIAPMDIS